VIAALLVIVVIQCLAVRERRRGAKKVGLEEGVVQTSVTGTESEESGSDIDSKLPRIQVGAA
jgi:hypothetical protein